MLAKTSLPMSVPEETASLAQRVFRKGNRYVTLRNELGLIFGESDFQDLYAEQGAPGVSAVQLALVTLVQYLEDLSDRDAADAVRSRAQRAPDLKYLLGLELADEGFDYSVLSEFRQRLVAGEAQSRLLDKLKSLPAPRVAEGRR